MTLAAFDFSSLFIPHIDDGPAQQMVAAGLRLPVIGFDPTEESRQVLGALLRAGCPSYDVYRFLNWSRPLQPQLDSVRQGILLAYQAGLGLPGVLWLDVEEEFANTPPAVDVRQALHFCIETMFGWQIGSQWDVKLGLYSGLWFVQKYGLLDYTEPGERGLLLWTTAASSDLDRAPVYFGCKRAEGVQYAEDQNSPIGRIDRDAFRDRGTPTPPLPPAPGPGPDLAARVLAVEQRTTDNEGRLAHIEAELAGIKGAIV